MKSWLLLISVMLLGGCAAQPSNQPPSSLENSGSKLVRLASSRAMQHDEFGGERDEQTLNDMAEIIRGTDDASLSSELRQLDPQKAVSLRVFFKKSDFEGKGLLLGGQPKNETLKLLDSLPTPPPWPIEKATCLAWMQPDLRLDWKASSAE